jgi:hypothetical protein
LKKDFKTSSEIKSVDFDNKAALLSYKNFKSYRLNSVKEGIIKISNAETIFNTKTDFTVLENMFYESSTKDYSFVEFQIDYKSKNGLLPNKVNEITDKERIDATIDRLLIKKNKRTGIIDYELISYIPDKTTTEKKLSLIQNKHNGLIKDFSGHVYHKNIGGEAMYLEVIKNGIITNKLYKAKKNGGLKVQNSISILNQEPSNCINEYCIEGYVYDSNCYCFTWGYECFSDCPPPTSQYPGVAEENGMLSFDSNQGLYDMITDLSNSVEAHNANFYDSKDAMTDDQVDEISEQENFDE